MGWLGDSYEHYDFEMFSASHFIVITIFILVSIGIYFIHGELNHKKWRRAEILAAISLILIETAYHVWMYVNENWKASQSLPLQLCNISLILCIILLLNRKKLIFEILLITALLGSTQAIITPALNYDFPHFRFLHFFYTHLMVVWVPLYFAWVKGFRPTIWSVLKLIVFLNLLFPVVMLINKQTGGNYLFLSKKPASTSLLDVLGPYPWYILSLEGLLILLSLIVWLIFREKGSKAHITGRNLAE